MKKILIVSPQLGGVGGIETVLLKLLHSHLVKEFNFELLILGEIKANSYRFKHLDEVDVTITNRSTKLYRAVDMIKYVSHNNADIIICLSREELMLSFYIRNLFRLNYKILSWSHFSLLNNKTNFKKYADYNLSISSGNTSELLKRGIPKENIFTIYNPISVTDITINRPSRNTNFVYVGRVLFNGQKNLRELIDGIATWHRTDWSMSFWGTGPDVAKCKKYIHKNYSKVEKQFKWNGWSKDPWTQIKTTNALILTSEFEGFPMVLLEAMAHGVPCVSSNCNTGPKDIIEEGINGYLYDLGNLRSFHKSLDNVVLLKSSPIEIKESIKKFSDEAYFSSFQKVLSTI